MSGTRNVDSGRKDSLGRTIYVSGHGDTEGDSEKSQRTRQEAMNPIRDIAPPVDYLANINSDIGAFHDELARNTHSAGKSRVIQGDDGNSRIEFANGCTVSVSDDGIGITVDGSDDYGRIYAEDDGNLVFSYRENGEEKFYDFDDAEVNDIVAAYVDSQTKVGDSDDVDTDKFLAAYSMYKYYKEKKKKENQNQKKFLDSIVQPMIRWTRFLFPGGR